MFHFTILPLLSALK